MLRDVRRAVAKPGTKYENKFIFEDGGVVSRHKGGGGELFERCHGCCTCDTWRSTTPGRGAGGLGETTDRVGKRLFLKMQKSSGHSGSTATTLSRGGEGVGYDTPSRGVTCKPAYRRLNRA